MKMKKVVKQMQKALDSMEGRELAMNLDVDVVSALEGGIQKVKELKKEVEELKGKVKELKKDLEERGGCGGEPPEEDEEEDLDR